MLSSGEISDRSFSDITNRLLFGNGVPADEYMVLADFESYKSAHLRLNDAYMDKNRWNAMSIVNIARSGIFASDRSIRQYADNIWHIRHK